MMSALALSDDSMPLGELRKNADIGRYEKWVKELMEKIESMGLKEIPVKSLLIDPEAMRFRDNDAVRRIKESRVRRGQFFNFPIVQKSSMKVISGNHRVWAARENGEESITVKLVDASDEEAWAIRLEENLIRRKMNKRELYDLFSRARDMGMTQEKMGEMVGLSHGRISQILSWGDSGFVERASGKVAAESIPDLTTDKSGVLQEVGSDALRPDTSPSPPSLEINKHSQQASEGEAAESVPGGTHEPADSLSNVVLGTPMPLEGMEETTPSPGASATVPALLSLPGGYVPIGDVMTRYQGFINSCLREAAKHAEDPGVRTWMESIYSYVKDALGYDK